MRQRGRGAGRGPGVRPVGGTAWPRPVPGCLRVPVSPPRDGLEWVGSAPGAVADQEARGRAQPRGQMTCGGLWLPAVALGRDSPGRAEGRCLACCQPCACLTHHPLTGSVRLPHVGSDQKMRCRGSAAFSSGCFHKKSARD